MIKWNHKIIEVSTGKEIALMELRQWIQELSPGQFQFVWLDDDGTIQVGDAAQFSPYRVIDFPNGYACAFQPHEEGKSDADQDCDYILYSLIQRRFSFDSICDEIWEIFERKLKSNNILKES